MEIHLKNIPIKIIGVISIIVFGYFSILFFISFTPGDAYWPLIVFLGFALLGVLLLLGIGESFVTEKKIQYRSRIFGVMEMKWDDVIRVETDNLATMGFFSSNGRLIISVPFPLSRKGKLLNQVVVEKADTLDFPVVINPMLQYKFSKDVRVKKN